MDLNTTVKKSDLALEWTSQLKNFITEITFKETNHITEDTLLFEEGIFDSLGFLSLISFISENFEVEIESDELNEDNFATIRSIIAFLIKKQ